MPNLGVFPGSNSLCPSLLIIKKATEKEGPLVFRDVGKVMPFGKQ